MKIPIRKLIKLNVIEQTSGELRLSEEFISCLAGYAVVHPNDPTTEAEWKELLRGFDRDLAALPSDELLGTISLFRQILCPVERTDRG